MLLAVLCKADLDSTPYDEPLVLWSIYPVFRTTIKPWSKGLSIFYHLIDSRRVFLVFLPLGNFIIPIPIDIHILDYEFLRIWLANHGAGAQTLRYLSSKHREQNILLNNIWVMLGLLSKCKILYNYLYPQDLSSFRHPYNLSSSDVLNGSILAKGYVGNLIQLKCWILALSSQIYYFEPKNT